MKTFLTIAALALFSTPALALAAPADFSSLPAPVVNKDVWQPGPLLRWQLQYSTTPVDLSVEADVYKIDLFDNDARAIDQLKRKGKHAVCYLNAGAWEDWRPDARRFPRAVVGGHYEGWEGERWLDIRRVDLLAPLMRARLDLCKRKGFAGVLFDNIDSHTHKTGFPLSAADQVRYIVWLANEARSRGLAVGLNNNPEHVVHLLPYFDWMLAESCFSQGWCQTLQPIVAAGKPVVVVEYVEDREKVDAMCKDALQLRVSFMMKKRELDAFRRECPASL